jgi:CheY-like chemotaxis protein
LSIEVRSILLVEDDPHDIELTLRALAEHNLANRVVVARDGVEALDYLQGSGAFAGDGPAFPAVLLLDIKMPRMNGLELLRRLRGDERLKSLPVVMLTSSSEEPDLRTAYNLGVNAYVVKPVEFGAFVVAVKELGVFWAILNEPPPER